MEDIEQLKYPIGKYDSSVAITPEVRHQCIGVIATYPQVLADTVRSLDQEQLDTPYRPGGWTVRQLVHHLADSHTNSLIRFKWGLTEDRPTIKAYDQGAWAELPDSSEPIRHSLDILSGVHHRWSILLSALSEAQWARELRHPEGDTIFTIDSLLGLYDWHCRHHLRHITALIEREGWAI